MKAYFGRNGHDVFVKEGNRVTPLRHVVKYSPTGFSWGYLGSGPADLSLSILTDCCNLKVADLLYQDFKFEFVSQWGPEFQISSDEILNWVKEKLYVKHVTALGRGNLLKFEG